MGSRTCARALLERTVRAGSCFNNVGALGLVAPFAASLLHHSLPPFELLHSSEHLHTQQPFLLTPACIFAICILILVAITIRSPPHKNCRVPAHLLHLPFSPVHVATFKSAPCNEVEERPALVPATSRLIARSSSYPCLARRVDEIQQARSPMRRSPSHSTFLIDAKPFRSAQTNDQDEAPAVLTRTVARTSSQPRLTPDADEMQKASGPMRRSPSPSAFLIGDKPFRAAQSNDPDRAPAVLTRGVARSSSQPCLARLAEKMQKANSPIRRSPSHSTFLTGAKPVHVQVATESLSDEEANRRFSAFIESRFAAMKRQMVE